MRVSTVKWFCNARVKRATLVRQQQPEEKQIGEMRLIDYNHPETQDTNSTIQKGEDTMENNEVQELLKKIDEYKQIIDDAENALDAAIMDLEEALEEIGE